jgi:hypothetical protein
MEITLCFKRHRLLLEAMNIASSMCKMLCQSYSKACLQGPENTLGEFDMLHSIRPRTLLHEQNTMKCSRNKWRLQRLLDRQACYRFWVGILGDKLKLREGGLELWQAVQEVYRYPHVDCL